MSGFPEIFGFHDISKGAFKFGTYRHKYLGYWKSTHPLRPILIFALTCLSMIASLGFPGWMRGTRIRISRPRRSLCVLLTGHTTQ